MPGTEERNANNVLRAVVAYLVSSVISGLFIAIIQFGSDASAALGSLGILIVPGYLPASLFYPEGFHSDSPRAFTTLIAVFNGLVYGVLVFLLWRWRRSRSGQGERPGGSPVL
jgi:hypothetical protein